MKKDNVPTPHINAHVGDFAEVVLMPGDPLRAKFIAENFLTDVKEINNVRGMLAFTGYYNNKKVSVMGHGMGNPSIGIYSYELFAFFNVNTIIRIGSCGSFLKDIDLNDIVIASSAISNSCYANCMNVTLDQPYKLNVPNKQLVEQAECLAKKNNLKHFVGNVLSSDAFYGQTNGQVIDKMVENKEILAVEMEAFALYTNAKKLNKNALCILTVSDSLVTHELMTAEQRQVGFKNMMKLALDLALEIK